MFEDLPPGEVAAAALEKPPGADVLAALAALDVGRLGEAARVDLLVALERHVGWLAGLLQPLYAAVGADAEAEACRFGMHPADALRAGHAQIQVALRLSEAAAAMRLLNARQLCGPLSAVRAGLLAGKISPGQANAIVEATLSLPEQQAAAVAAKVLGRAPQQTVAQLRRCLRRAVLAADPKAAKKRAQQAKAERKLQWWSLPDGMAELRYTAPVEDVLAVYRSADALAHTLAEGHPFGSDGWQPLAARRADALVALTAGRFHPDATVEQALAQLRGRFRIQLNVTMDLPTALGLQDNPAELSGYGPLPAHLARALAVDGRWRRLIYEPLSGELLDLGHTSYQPSPALARYIRARDMTCGFPGCSRPAEACELDHGCRYNQADPPRGGRTDRKNLGPFCRFHHVLKHKAGWTLARDEHGRATWTSPTGHQYRVPAHDYRPHQADGTDTDDPPWDWEDDHQIAQLLEDEPPPPLDTYEPTIHGNWLGPASADDPYWVPVT